VMVGVLLIVDRLFRIRPPALFALYVSLYTFGRFFEELLRIDPAHEFAGLRLNAWVSIVLFICSTAFFIWWQFFEGRGLRRRRRAAERTPKGPRMAIPKGRVRPSR
jgi:prolipoprotein diacylglyceryltransferase